MSSLCSTVELQPSLDTIYRQSQQKNRRKFNQCLLSGICTIGAQLAPLLQDLLQVCSGDRVWQVAVGDFPELHIWCSQALLHRVIVDVFIDLQVGAPLSIIRDPGNRHRGFPLVRVAERENTHTNSILTHEGALD